MARRTRQSPTLLPEAKTGREIPVVLNSKYISIDALVKKSDRTRELAKFARDNASNFCLFSGETFRCSPYFGVCLASQVEEICQAHRISGIRVVSQHENFFYVATVEQSGFVEKEEILDIESDAAKTMWSQDIVALRSVVGAEESGIEVIDNVLYLAGRPVKNHLFTQDTKAFSEAGYIHPKRKRQIVALAILGLIVVVSLVSYLQYRAAEEQKRLQEQARKILPKIGSDDIVPQLRVYARWLQDNMDSYEYYGAQTITIKDSIVDITGRVRKNSYVEFYERHKDIKKLPVTNFANETYLDLQQTVQAESSNPFGLSKWRLNLVIQEHIPKADKFGMELYDNYLTAIYPASLRLGLGFSAAPPPMSTTGMVQGELVLTGQMTSLAVLYDISNMMIGIPSYARELTIVTPDDESKPPTFTMKIVMSGRS